MCLGRAKKVNMESRKTMETWKKGFEMKGGFGSNKFFMCWRGAPRKVGGKRKREEGAEGKCRTATVVKRQVEATQQRHRHHITSGIRPPLTKVRNCEAPLMRKLGGGDVGTAFRFGLRNDRVQFPFAAQQNSLSLSSDTRRGFLLGRSPKAARECFLLFLGGRVLYFGLFAELWPVFSLHLL